MLKNSQDFFAGLLFLVAGLVFAIGSRSYPMGSTGAMGPGYFPMLLGSALALVGIAVATQAVVGKARPDQTVGAWAWHPLACIIGASILFALCLSGVPILGVPVLGMGIGVYVLVIVASLASARFEWRSVLALATVLAVGSYLVFIRALGLLIPMWPWFIAA